MLCEFWFRYVLRATTAWSLSSLIWQNGSAPADLASLLYLLFDPPEPQITGKTEGFAHSLPFRARAHPFPRPIFLFFSSLSDSSYIPTSAFSSVHFVGSLTFKLYLEKMWRDFRGSWEIWPCTCTATTMRIYNKKLMYISISQQAGHPMWFGPLALPVLRSFFCAVSASPSGRPGAALHLCSAGLKSKLKTCRRVMDNNAMEYCNRLQCIQCGKEWNRSLYIDLEVSCNILQLHCSIIPLSRDCGRSWKIYHLGEGPKWLKCCKHLQYMDATSMIRLRGTPCSGAQLSTSQNLCAMETFHFLGRDRTRLWYLYRNRM